MIGLQALRLISIGAAFLVGFWLPIRLVDFHLPVVVDVAFDLFISLVSIVNIYIHFREKEESFRNWRTWTDFGVLLDLICFVPFSVELLASGSQSSSLVLLNLLAARHIWRIKSFLDQFTSIQPVVYRLIPIGVMMPLLVHLVACGWIKLGSGTAGPDADKMFEYIKAVYWSFTTLTTVGYGDISAKTPGQMLFAAVVQVMGVGVFGFVLSNVASLLTRLDAAREHHMDNLDKIETFMRSHHLPGDLKGKVRGYYHYLWSNHKGYNNRSIIRDLPLKMQSEIFFFLNQSVIEKVPLLKGASQELLEDLMHELEPRIFVPNERIFRIDEHGDAMYFIHNGQVDILTRDGQKIVTLGEGGFFGETALIIDTSRTATAQAKSYCDLYRLPRRSFERVVNAYPEFKIHLEDLVRERNQSKSA